MIAALYARKSTVDARRPGKSVADQLREGRARCATAGYDLRHELRDDGIGASRHSRQVARAGFEELLRLVEEQAVQVVVLPELTRATRRLATYAVLVDACAEAGIRLDVSARMYDLNEPTDRLALGVTAVVGEHEAEVIRARVLRGIRGSAAAGRPHGKLLYGYRREYDPTSGALLRQVLDEPQAAVVREAARRVLAGDSCYSVALDFNARGIATPRAGELGWNLVQIKRALVNPAYAGKRVHQGVVVGDGDWPPVLDELTHRQLVRLLTDPARFRERPTAVTHLLSGIAACGPCGGRLRCQKNRGYMSYVCVPGFCVSMREEKLDAYVVGAVLQWLGRPDVAPALAQRDGAERTQTALAEAAEIRARLDGFIDAAAAGELSPAALARIEGTLLPRIARLERQARPALPTAAADLAAAGDANARRAAWEALPLTVRRSVISGLMQPQLNAGRRGVRAIEPGRITLGWL